MVAKVHVLSCSQNSVTAFFPSVSSVSFPRVCEVMASFAPAPVGFGRSWSWPMLLYWAGQKFVYFFLCDASSNAAWSLTSFKTILLDCIVTAVISVYI